MADCPALVEHNLIIIGCEISPEGGALNPDPHF